MACRLPFSHALMAHRGGSLEYVENTMPAFRHAANVVQADLLELDCQLTKDGLAVIFHDDNLKKMCQVDGKRISDFNYHDLPKLVPSKELPVHIQTDPESLQIPLLETLLKEFPQYPMQIDVKGGPEELVIKVGLLIKKYKREKNTLWGSFRWTVNRQCHKHFGTDIPLFYDMPSALFSFLCWSLGSWRFYKWINTRYSCLILPNANLFMRKGWFNALNGMGIPVILFGLPSGSIHTTELFHKARNVQVNGICSDKPSLLRDFLANYPLKNIKKLEKQ